jgi:hypothetical protein
MVRVPRVDVKATTVGRENVVVLAVKSEALDPVDFVSLSQKTIKQALRDEKVRGRGGLNSPLGQLLRNAVFRDGTKRAMGQAELTNYTLGLIPVQVEPGRRKK